MKKIFVLVLFLAPIIPFFSHAQISSMIRIGNSEAANYETIDTAVLKVLYEFKSPGDSFSEKFKEKEKTDTTKTRLQSDYMVLEYGTKNISRFYSENRRRMDSLMTEIIKQSPSNIRIDKDVMDRNGISSHGTELVVYKNYPNGKITVTDRIGRSSYLYEEPADEIQWQITSDTMTCLNYLCQKAVCDFRGRHYDAWFAPDLPINDGPMKFSGLPGLILNIADSDSLYIFKAVGLETYTLPIQFSQKKYLKASRKEVEKVKKKSVEDPIGFLTNSNPDAKISIKIKDDNGAERSAEEMKFKYNPMELE